MKQDNSLKRVKCSELANKIKEKYDLKKTLYLNSSNFRLFDTFQNTSNLEIQYFEKKTNNKNVLCGDPFILLDQINDRFDFIIGDLPFGMMSGEWKDGEKNISLKGKKNWLILFKSLFLLTEEGQGLFVVEPSIVWNKEFIQQLSRKGFYVNAIFNCPENLLRPQTSLQTNLLLISRKKTDSVFAIELSEETVIEDMIEAYDKNSQGSDFTTGRWVIFDKFRGFREAKISEKITKLLEQYKTFKVYSLKQISLSISIGDKISSQDNSIYVPRNGRIIQLDYEKLKSKNYYQIVLNTKYALAEYLVLFFNTGVGRSIMELIETGIYIPNKKRSDLEKLEIPLPELEMQKEIIELNHNLMDLNNKISNFEKEIAISPLSCQKIKSEVNKMLNSLNLLNDSDKILSLIRDGESKTLEFKETLSKNIRTNQKDKEMQKAVLKTIVGFLNTEGGILLIGVNDNGSVEGIEKDFFEKNDVYLKHVHNLIRDQIGEQFFPLIDYNIILINDKKIVRVDCKKSKTPVYLGKDEEFYIRSNPATDKLTGKRLVEYIKNHFGGDLT
jgi:hypothetical protein